jgi:hypothetical protein
VLVRERLRRSAEDATTIASPSTSLTDSARLISPPGVAASVWSDQLNNLGRSIEAGYGSGYAVGRNGGWTTALQPYYTTSDGLGEVTSTSANLKSSVLP